MPHNFFFCPFFQGGHPNGSQGPAVLGYLRTTSDIANGVGCAVGQMVLGIESRASVTDLDRGIIWS